MRTPIDPAVLVSLERKREYVAQQKKTRPHTCHWPGCERQVKPALWGCQQHWFTLPKTLRDRIWRTFDPGQECTLTPSDAYLDAVDAVDQWIRQYKQRIADARARGR